MLDLNEKYSYWKTCLANNKTSENKANSSELQWFLYFTRQFAEPDTKWCDKFESDSNDWLLTPGPGIFVGSTPFV